VEGRGLVWERRRKDIGRDGQSSNETQDGKGIIFAAGIHMKDAAWDGEGEKCVQRVRLQMRESGNE
jgi:hypothetical protein